MTPSNLAAPAVPTLSRSLFKADRPRAIDRVIDFFGERRPTRHLAVPRAAVLAMLVRRRHGERRA